MPHTQIQIRRGSAAFWESENPILHDGEPGYERDTRRLKIGDGATHWRELPYSAGGELVPSDPGDVIPADLAAHIADLTPHPVYDDGPRLDLLYQNAKV
jgi:hypothetical protein